MIIIDGRASDLRIENFANLEEILVEANICGGGQRRLRFTHMMFLIMFSPDFMVEKYEKSRKILN